MVETLQKADTHMQRVIEESNGLYDRIVQINEKETPSLGSKMTQLVDDNIQLDISSQDVLDNKQEPVEGQ